MQTILFILATGAAGVLGFVQTRRFVATRLRYVDAVRSPWAAIAAGAGATLVALPVFALVGSIIPIVSAFTAVVFGGSVAAGVISGVKEMRRITG